MIFDDFLSAVRFVLRARKATSCNLRSFIMIPITEQLFTTSSAQFRLSEPHWVRCFNDFPRFSFFSNAKIIHKVKVGSHRGSSPWPNLIAAIIESSTLNCVEKRELRRSFLVAHWFCFAQFAKLVFDGRISIFSTSIRKLMQISTSLLSLLSLVPFPLLIAISFDLLSSVAARKRRNESHTWNTNIFVANFLAKLSKKLFVYFSH